MNFTSKFRQMYWAKNIIGFFTGIFFAIGFFRASIMYDGKINFQYFSFWIAIIIIVGLVVGIISVLMLETIIVTEKYIIFKYLFFNVRKVLKYDDILSAERFKTQMKLKGGPVSDGYHSTALNLIDGNREIISSDLYENYQDIINAIRLNMKHEA